jgi:hypothetical protein
LLARGVDRVSPVHGKVETMKFIVTLVWPKRAFRNDDRVESNDFLDAPSAEVGEFAVGR